MRLYLRSPAEQSASVSKMLSSDDILMEEKSLIATDDRGRGYIQALGWA